MGMLAKLLEDGSYCDMTKWLVGFDVDMLDQWAAKDGEQVDKVRPKGHGHRR